MNKWTKRSNLKNISKYLLEKLASCGQGLLGRVFSYDSKVKMFCNIDWSLEVELEAVGVVHEDAKYPFDGAQIRITFVESFRYDEMAIVFDVWNSKWSVNNPPTLAQRTFVFWAKIAAPVTLSLYCQETITMTKAQMWFTLRRFNKSVLWLKSHTLGNFTVSTFWKNGLLFVPTAPGVVPIKVFLGYAGFKLSDWLIKNFQPIRVLQTSVA